MGHFTEKWICSIKDQEGPLKYDFLYNMAPYSCVVMILTKSNLGCYIKFDFPESFQIWFKGTLRKMIFDYFWS